MDITQSRFGFEFLRCTSGFIIMRFIIRIFFRNNNHRRNALSNDTEIFWVVILFGGQRYGTNKVSEGIYLIILILVLLLVLISLVLNSVLVEID